jgi:hypothetical protein
MLGLLAAAVPARADASPQQKALAQRAAELDAYRQLAGRLLGLQVKAETHAEDFTTAFDRIGEQLDHVVRGLRLDAQSVIYYPDGECEVAADATVEQTVTTRKTVRDEYGVDGEWHAGVFRETERRTTREVIRAHGSGVIADATPGRTADAGPPLPRRVTHGATPRTLPPIYERVPARVRLRARRAATLDAHRKLVERVSGLRITATSTVQDFLSKADEIHVTAASRLVGVRTDDVVYRPDGLVQVHVSLPVEQVIEMLQEIREETDDGAHWTRETFENMRRHVDCKTVTAVGVGALELGGADVPVAETAAPARRVRHTRAECVIERTLVDDLDRPAERMTP